MPKKNLFKIRRMHVKDLKQVLNIEKTTFEQPYSLEILAQELKIEAAKVYVAVLRRKVVGYIDFWIVQDEMELVSIAVHVGFKKQGVGNQLMQHMINVGKSQGVNFVSLDVRTSNAAAQGLYQKFGFRKVGVRKAYYSDNSEDAIIMKKDLETS